MKTMTLPKQLLNLPQPWGKTHPEQRREGIDLLSYETDSIKTALNVLERCLHTLSDLTFSISEHIPEELYELMPSSAQWLALRIPIFDDFDLKKIELFLINDEGIDSPSPLAGRKRYLSLSLSSKTPKLPLLSSKRCETIVT